MNTALLVLRVVGAGLATVLAGYVARSGATRPGIPATS